MAEIKVFYDQQGNTHTVWFGDPAAEAYAEEIGNEIVVMKSDDGAVLGFEKLNFSFAKPEELGVTCERLAA